MLTVKRWELIVTQTVVLTGASGFIAKHVALKLLDRGHAVRGTLRSPARAEEVRAALRPHLAETAALDRLSLVTLDLTREEGWQAAMDGATALVHTASPFPIAQPKVADDLIRPAVDGTRRALMAAHRAGIGRAIVTSSTVAIMGAERPANGADYTGADWTDPESRAATPYARSKTLAERAGWEIAQETGIAMTTIHPSLVLGPPLDTAYGSSVGVVERILRARDPALPRFSLPCVDVRDVAEAHVRALERPETAGERIIASDRTLWMVEMAAILKQAHPGRRIVTRQAPDWLVRLLSLMDAEIRSILPELGVMRSASNAAARKLLGMEFRPADEALRATAEWLIANGRV